MSHVTQLLSAVDRGNPKAAEQLLPLVYDGRRKLAAAKLVQERPGQTLQATALVPEAWLRLAGAEAQQVWNSRGHFFGAAAEARRRILVDRARQKARVRHGGALERVDLAHVNLATEDGDATVLAMHAALEMLARASPQKAEIVKLRYFPGLENQELADALGISLSSVERSWAYARSWRHREMKKNLSSG